jgi:SAM-dependent methyltransferase
MTAPDLTVSSDTDPYGAVAGYYDLLHIGSASPALVSFFVDLAPPGGDALEIGPGTGRMTLAVAERAGSVLGLERSPSMRAVLLTKLARRPALRDRVTVLDVAAPGFRLGRRFDYVYLAAVLEHVPAAARPALFATLAEHLAPGGVLAMDMVHDREVPDQPERETRSAHVGACRYVLSSAAWPLGPDLGRVRHVYRTYHGDALVATETVERDHHLHRPPDVIADLRTAGLTAVGGSALGDARTPLSDRGTLVARHEDLPV